MHAITFGIDGVDDLVLKACLNDEACDVSSEDGKTEYLYGMFKNTPYFSKFREIMLTTLKTKRKTWDIDLMLKLALHMAKAGDSDARKTIIDKALWKANQSSVDNWDVYIGSEELIALTGMDGAIELARIYGSRLLKNPQAHFPQGETFPSKEFKGSFHEILLASKEPGLKAYLNYLEKEGVFLPRTGPYTDTATIHKRHKEEIRQQYNLNMILNNAKHEHKDYVAYFIRFGWAATKEELEIIYQHLLNETDNVAIFNFLKVFTRVPLPYLDDKVFSWAYSKNDQVRFAAMRALSHTTDERVHELARDKIQTSKLRRTDSYVIELFFNNYRNSDAKLIIDTLRRTRPSKQDAEWITWDIIELSEKNHDAGLADALRWSYEKTPDSYCRYKVVKQLDSLGQLEGEILYECQYDGERDIVTLAKNKGGLP